MPHVSLQVGRKKEDNKKKGKWIIIKSVYETLENKT